MVKASGTLRDYPAGPPKAGVTVTIKRLSDDATLATRVTDAAGRWDYEANGSPGPWYWTATSGGVTRAGASSSSGSGGAYSLAELPALLRALETGLSGGGVVSGYLNALAVSYDGAGLDLDVAAGALSAAGVPVVFGATTNHAVTTARDATNPKACYLVVEVTPPGQTEEGKAVIKDVCGTAAASPALPALTNTETLRQVKLATFQLPNSGSTTLSNLVDARQYLLDPATLSPKAMVSAVVRRTDPATETTTTSTTGADVVDLTTTLTLVNGVTYDLAAHALLVCKIDASGNTVQIAPYLNGTANLAPYVSGNHTAYAALGNTHALGAVLGSGAAVACGLQIKVSGGTAAYTVGYLLVTATPR